MKHFFSIFLFVSALIQSCHKDTEILPQATQNGKGVFACMYDGRPLTITGAYATYNTDYTGEIYLQIVADVPNAGNLETIHIVSSNVETPGTYPLDKTPLRIAVRLPDSDYIYDSYSGIVEFTKVDTIQKIISGKFNADLLLVNSLQQGIPGPRPDVKDTLMIRSGRFDLPLSIVRWP